MNSERFLDIQEKARKLINLDQKGVISKLAKTAVSEGKIDIADSESGIKANKPTPSLSESFGGTSDTSKPLKTNNVSQHRIKTSKLPKEILDSMISHPIEVSSSLNVNESVLDQINRASNGRLYDEVAPPKQEIIQEEFTPSRTTSPQVASSIDYSLIRMMMEETVKKYVGNLKKTMLNESKNGNSINSLKAMKIGDKFSFITENGDLYEAKLTFIKNLNKKGEN